MLAAVGGLVTVRSQLSPPPAPALAAGTLAAPAGGSGSTPTPSSHHRTHRSHRRHHPSTGPAPARHTAQAAPTRRQVTGSPFDVGYGIVQVRVTLVGNRITDITALSLPQGGRSSDISSYAAPQLRKEALAAQSARIDAVSGASYTSAGYARSLQSALDKARGA
jgi:uncharacterized protein with FMN-binding domain